MAEAEKVCRLCLKVTSSNICSPIDGSFIYKLQLLIPNLDLTPSINPVVCNVCRVLLEDSHKLKRTCSSSNKLIHFLKDYSKTASNVDLKDLIQGKKKDSGNNENVCRICLKNNEGTYTGISNLKSEEFGMVLHSCISTLDQNLTANPLICKICFDTLHNMCIFINQLTDVENKVKLYHEKVPSGSVDLNEVLNFSDQDENEQFLSEYEKNEQEARDNISAVDEKLNKTTSEAEVENKKRHLSDDLNDEPSKKQKTESDDETDDGDSGSISEENSNCITDINGLPYFNFSIANICKPFRRKLSLEYWLEQVEKIKLENNWSDTVTKQKVLWIMRKVPSIQSWFSSAADIMSWDEWKQKVRCVCPERNDYFMNIFKLMSRKKKPNETFINYFNDKVLLFEPLNLTKEQQMSCLLGGITDVFFTFTARIGNYKTPEELMTHFKSYDHEETKNKKSSIKKDDTESHHGNNEVSVAEQVEVQKQNTTDKKCSVCDRLGHSSIDCPLIKPKHTSSTNGKQNEDISGKKCYCCHQIGHLSMNCPRIKTNKTQILKKDKTSSNNDLEKTSTPLAEKSGKEDKLNESAVESKGEEASSKLLGEQQSEMKQDQKCLCCDKWGHSSLDCPFIKSKGGLQQAQSSGKPGTDIEKKSQDARIIIISDEKIQNAGRKNQNQTKCSYCDNFGHSSINCSLIKEKSKENRGNIRIVLDKARIDKINLRNDSFDNIRKDELICEVVQKKQPSSSQNKKERIISQKCSCCDKFGHASLNCPLIMPNKSTATDISKIEVISETRNSAQNTSQKYSNCHKCGHFGSSCECRKSSNTSINQNTDKDVVNTSMSENIPSQSKTVQETFKKMDCTLTGINKSVPDKISIELPSNDELSVKQNKRMANRQCLCCGNIGHASLDCPLLVSGSKIAEKSTLETQQDVSGPSQENEPPEKINKVSRDTKSRPVLKCDFCQKIGHRVSECFSARFDRNMYATHHSDGSMSRQCLYCGKFGHIQPDCPKNKRPDKRMEHNRQHQYASSRR